MSNIKKTVKGIFFVNITKPTEEDLDQYYASTGELKSSNSSNGPLRIFQKAEILNTFDEEEYPVGSIWMIGETPGIKINFFGKKYIEIQEKDLHARID